MKIVFNLPNEDRELIIHSDCRVNKGDRVQIDNIFYAVDSTVVQLTTTHLMTLKVYLDRE